MKRLKLSPLAPRITATVSIPGSKSYTNRALLLAAMTPQPVKLLNPLLSDDTQAMLDCLQCLGIDITTKKRAIEVVGDVRTAVSAQDYDLDVNLSGTTLRFILALSTVIPGVQTLRGGPGLHKRPIGDMVTALTQLGAKIEYLGQTGYPPLRVTSSKLSEGTVTLPGTESSQYLSALLMIAPLIGDLKIVVTGGLISRPFVAMTIASMKQFGVKVISTKQSYHIAAGQQYQQSHYSIEGDVSSASYFLAIAALTQSTITVTNMNPRSLQADMAFLKILEQMGNQLSYGQDSITLTGKGVWPVTVNMQDCPDQAPTLAVLAAFARGTTTITGIQSLRIKETERIQALQQELQKMTIQTTSTPDTLVIHGGKPRAASIATYGDHRMAMSFAVAGAKLPDMEIQEPDVVAKTFPDFWEALASLHTAPDASKPVGQNIVLIGMRGTGKTTIARSLAATLHRDYIDLDEIMVKKTGLATGRLVEKYGWEYFRDEEAAIAKETAALRGKIISTGGGVVLKPANVAALKTNGYVILLRASAETLLKRLEATAADRPKLTTQKTLLDEIRQVMRDRRQAYEAAADTVIDTDDLVPREVAEIIIELLEKRFA
jgi:3-phosphoshikimate 1-carboxyvinyltransferase